MTDELLHRHVPVRPLHSEGKNLLVIPKNKVSQWKTFSFYCCPNDLKFTSKTHSQFSSLTILENSSKLIFSPLKLLVQLMTDLLDFCWDRFWLLLDAASSSDWWSQFEAMYWQNVTDAPLMERNWWKCSIIIIIEAQFPRKVGIEPRWNCLCSDVEMSLYISVRVAGIKLISFRCGECG